MAGSWTNALVVLTRPRGRNEPLAQRLSGHGLETLALPVLKIAPVTASCPPPQPQDYDLVVFVSGNAVANYFQQLDQAGAMPAMWPDGTRVAVVGVATAQAVLDTGLVPAANIVAPDAAQTQDSESLWRLLQPLAAGMNRALIVRGQDGREWLGRRLEQAGLTVVRHASYERRTSEWPPALAAQLQAGVDAGRPVVCLLTSVHGVQAFFDNIARHGLSLASSGFHYVVIHPRIAGRLQSLLGSPSGKVDEPVVTICPPDEDAIAEAVLSLASR